VGGCTNMHPNVKLKLSFRSLENSTRSSSTQADTRIRLSWARYFVLANCKTSTRRRESSARGIMHGVVLAVKGGVTALRTTGLPPWAMEGHWFPCDAPGPLSLRCSCSTALRTGATQVVRCDAGKPTSAEYRRSGYQTTFSPSRSPEARSPERRAGRRAHL
jgi:hypothetical protein